MVEVKQGYWRRS